MFTPWNRLFLPLPLDLVIFIALWAIKIFLIAFSFFVGALICWFGELCFTAIMYHKIQHKKPQGFMGFFILAETLKLLIFAILFVLAVVVFRLHLFPAFAGFILNLACYWILSFKALGEN